MNERERADMLARTIDELIRGARADIRVEDDDDLRSLIRIARARREAGIESGRQAADHESAIWKLLVARMEAGQPKPDDDDRGHDGSGAASRRRSRTRSPARRGSSPSSKLGQTETYRCAGVAGGTPASF
jgi:hypothetical protein